TNSNPSMDLPDSVDIVHALPKEFFATPNRWEELFTIIVEGRELKAHKEILKSRVPFFHGLLSSNMAEVSTGKTHLRELDATTTESLLDYIYTGTLTITESNAQILLMGSAFLQMEAVRNECVQFMSRRIRIDNAIDMLRISSHIADDKLEKTVLRFIDV
ncbi:hypothetical protein PENTCL1PPCAC_4659, partial [Pristionchus entomophagus]